MLSIPSSHPPSLLQTPALPILEPFPERASTPVPLTTAGPVARPDAEAPQGPQQPSAPQKIKLSLQAWKKKKQAEKQEQQLAGWAEARGMSVGHPNVGGTARALLMSVNSALGGGGGCDEEQGALDRYGHYETPQGH